MVFDFVKPKTAKLDLVLSTLMYDGAYNFNTIAYLVMVISLVGYEFEISGIKLK